MAINPITVPKLKTFVLLGHSNADGWAPYTDLASSPTRTWLSSRTGQSWRTTTPTEHYYDNCYVATSAQPFPGSGGTPVTTTPGQVEWLELTTANTADPGDAHPHPSPYDYPNNRGGCYPRYYYYHYPAVPTSFYQTPNSADHLGTLCGVEIPLMWGWQHTWGEQVGMVKMAFSSTLMMNQAGGSKALGNISSSWLGPLRPGVPSSVDSANYPYYGYWTPDEKFDWAPYSGRIYQMWYEKMVGAAAALPEGVEMDVQLVVLWMGDNEALIGNRERLGSFEENFRALIAKIRQDIRDNNWSTLDEKSIPIVVPSVHPGYGPGQPENPSPDFVTADFCNAAIKNIAAADDYVSWVDASAWATLADASTTPIIVNASNHYGAGGYITGSQAILDAWSAMLDQTPGPQRSVEEYDAFDIDDAMTVDEARRRVRLYYGRSKAQTDIDDDLLLLHLNAAMQHCLNQLGDNCWWLRRIDDIYLDAGPNKAVTLPLYIDRLMKIEDPSDLEYPLRFEQLGHVDGGKLQILMNERGQGTYRCHFITMPKELTTGDEKLPCPKNIAEWIVVETCARLAGSSTNAALAGFFAGESAKLQDSARRSVSQTQRTKRDRMKTVRRYPNLGYRRSHYQLWANDNSR